MLSIYSPIKNDVCLQNTSKSHSYHLKIWTFSMTLWIGYGAVLKVPASGN